MAKWEIAILGTMPNAETKIAFYTSSGSRDQNFKSDSLAHQYLLSEGWEPLQLVSIGDATGTVDQLPGAKLNISLMFAFVFRRKVRGEE